MPYPTWHGNGEYLAHHLFHCKAGLSERAKQMVMSVDENVDTYFGSKENYTEFIRSILNDGSLPEYNRVFIANELLKYGIYNKTDLVLSKQELQDIIYRLFDQYLQCKKGYDDTVYSFYLFNDDSRDDGYIILNARAHQRLLEFLSIPENLEAYLRYLIRSRSLPTNGESVFAPFTKNIFGDWQVLRKWYKNIHLRMSRLAICSQLF